MNALALKISVGTVALGSIGTATYFGAKELLRKTTIEEFLRKEKFKFIEFQDIEQWNAEYESDAIKIKQKFGELVNSGKSLRDKCKSIMNSDSEKNKDSIENAKNWCGIRSIISQLKRKNKKFLVNMEGNSDEVGEKWTATYNKRKQDQTNRAILGLEGTWPTNKNEIEDLKKLCSNKGNSYFLVKEINIYTSVENWCTEEGANLTVNK